MTTDELIECGTLLAIQQKGKLSIAQSVRLSVLKAVAKRDLPTGNTDIVKKQIAEVLALQIGADILKALEVAGKEVAKIALPLLITTLTDNIKLPTINIKK